VGSIDLSYVLNDWGNAPPNNAQADATRDGFTGAGDLNIVLTDWGKSPGDGVSGVPEPSTVAMTLFALLLILAVRYRNVGC